MKKISVSKGGMIATITTFVVSLGLIIGGFFVPPLGVIDGSVLTAVGELFMFGVLFEIPYFARLNKSLKISKGDTTIELNDENKQV